MLANLRVVVTSQLSRVELVRETPPPPEMPREIETHHMDPSTGVDEFDGETMTLAAAAQGVVPAEERDPNDPSTWGKVGRNEACPCGSGKKYKHCHGAFE